MGIIREIRRHKELSQSDMGEYMALPQTTYSRWEREERFEQEAVEILKLMKILDITLEDIAGGEFKDYQCMRTERLKEYTNEELMDEISRRMSKE